MNEKVGVSLLTKLARLSSYILAGVLVLLPFHAFLTVALGGLTGQYDLLRLWKEMILLVLAMAAVVIIWKTPDLWQRLKSSWLFWCIAAYVVLHVTLGLVALLKGQVNNYALVYAWIINLRLVLVFVIGLALAAVSPWLRERWRSLLLWPAVVVVAFGLLQLVALPPDFLQRFGYGADTIAPYTTVDQKLEYIRVQSSLRGANPLGAYLVLILAALTAILLRYKRGVTKENQQLAGVTLFSACLITLVATYSRSAYAGAALAVLLAIWLVLHGRQARRRLGIGLVVFAVIAGSAALVLRQNDRFENVFFHTNEHSSSPMSSNESRLSALQSGSGDVLREPFGRGPGTAGPASVHNVRPARIAENYYVQIAQEVGWVGLGLFAAINLLIARDLWRRRAGMLPRVLLASLAGISLVNLVQHAWTDDTLGIIWWGLAGIAAAPAILSGKFTRASAEQHISAETLRSDASATPPT